MKVVSKLQTFMGNKSRKLLRSLQSCEKHGIHKIDQHSYFPKFICRFVYQAQNYCEPPDKHFSLKPGFSVILY